MNSILPLDEINKFRIKITKMFSGGGSSKLTKKDEDDIIDELLDLFLLAYANGVNASNESLSFEWKPSIEDVMETVDKKVAGKTWRERIEEYFGKARKGEIPVMSSQSTAEAQSGEGESSTGKSQSGATGKGSESGQTNLLDSIIRIAETESHRDANEAAYDTAVHAGATKKTWVCMMIPTSRDSHIFLNGTTIPIDAEFYADDGSHAMFPGQFGVPEQDCNCLCVLSFE